MTIYRHLYFIVYTNACYWVQKIDNIKRRTWNIRTVSKDWKLENVKEGMKRLKISLKVMQQRGGE